MENEKLINEILELVRLNEHFSMKSNSILAHINKIVSSGGIKIEHMVREDIKCRKIAADAHNEAVEKIKQTNTFFAMFRLLDKSIQSKDIEKENKIRNLFKKKFEDKLKAEKTDL